MIRYNFRPNLTDHTQVLILVKPFYNASDKDYNYALKKLVVFTHAKVEGSLNRNILLKFTKGYTRDTLEWGRLQLHRRPLGFIGVARLSNDPVQHKKDFEKIEHRFGNVISQYDNHIYDSRCIVVGPENPDTTIPKKGFLYVPLTGKEDPAQLAEFLNEFISSIFVILESKRVDKMGENIDKMILPTAPSEQEQTITESDTRFMKKKFIGRNKKVLGDVSLLAGLYEESVTHYLTAVEHGQSCNDYLWTGSALEGICAASNAISLGNDIIKQNSLSLVIAKSSVNVHTTSESDSEQGKQSGCVLTVDDMISKYSECLNYYRRSSTTAGPVVLEAHFKFIRVLLKLKKKIEVAQVVQSLLALPITFNDTEQTEQSSMLASIHEQCEMHRKAAFYRRKAAMSYIKVADVDIAQAMAWLKRATPAYKIYLDGNGKKSESSGAAGWPTVQLTVLLNMLEISRRLENRLECVRLLCYILEKFAKHMNWVDHSELVELLEEYSDTASSSSTSGENSVVSVSESSNAQLIRPIPIIRGFAPKKLAYHLQPLKTKKTESSGPFIFSSLSTKVKSKEENVVWVCGDVAEVAMVVDNPLPVEIKVSNMMLLTDGVNFKAFPATLALPAQSGSYPFMLLGTPEQPGQLNINGYKLDVLGVTNTVSLPKPITVAITPALPVLRISSTLPRAPSSLNPEDEDYQTLFTTANLYRGHSCYCTVTLENDSAVAISKLNVKVKKPKVKNILFDLSDIQSKLPIEPKELLKFEVTFMPEDSWQFHSSVDKIEITVTVNYSCSEGEVDGYSRTINWITNVKVMPSLEFSNIEIKEIERHSECSSISFEATNMTSVRMDIECFVNNEKQYMPVDCAIVKKLELNSKEKQQLFIHFPRVSLTPESKWEANGSVLYPLKTSGFLMTSGAIERNIGREWSIETTYEKFVRELVNFKWRLSDTNYKGVTYFRKVDMTEATIKTLKPKHLRISIEVDGETIKEGEKIPVEECQLVNMKITLKNQHENNLENMALHINPYQMCYRSQEEMDQLCLPSGSLNTTIKKLTPGETYQHECGLLFLYKGEYLVDVSCSANQKFGKRSSQSRLRAYAVLDNKDGEEDTSMYKPFSPRTVDRKLRMFDVEFWAQSFALAVSC